MSLSDELRRGGVPMALWAQTTVPENATAIPFDHEALTNPYRTCFVIDAITMLASLSNTQVEQSLNLGQTLRLRLTLGHLGICQDWVPIWGFAPRVQSTLVTIGSSPPGDVESTAGLTGAYAIGPYVAYSTFLWKLPKPLVVAPGMTLVPSLLRGVDGLGGSATAEMCYLGRRMPESFRVPKEIDVPFVARFLPPEVVVSAPNLGQVLDPAFLQSQDRADLTNPFDVPLRVRKIIYRTQGRPGTLVIVENDTTPITLFASNNRKLIDNLQANVVFDRTRMAWNANFDLPPGENITLQIPKTQAAAYNNSPVQYTVSMVGYRTERL